MPEKYAILRALQLAAERQYPGVIIRSDCNAMRKQLKHDLQSQDGYNKDVVHQHIIAYSQQFEKIQFPYHPRRKNYEAHTLARYAVHELSPQPRPEMFRDYPVLPRAIIAFNDVVLDDNAPDEDPIPY